jgi:hypothetical protein
MLSAILLLAVAPSAVTPAEQLNFVCEGGRRFSVRYEEAKATITTAAGSYVLPQRKSGIGRKFLTDEVAYIQDGDMAVLVGAAGGPFVRCHLPSGEMAKR